MATEDRLDGWKDIACHLGRDIRTCQRWSQRLGLPIYRIDADSARGKVYAYRSELEAWLKSRGPNIVPPEPPAESAAPPAPPPARFRRSRIEIAFLILLVLVAAAVMTRLLRIPFINAGGPKREPVSMALAGTSLAASDSAGRFLWDVRLDIPQDLSRYVFGSRNGGKTVEEAYASYGTDFADVDGDGRNEVAAFLMNKDPKERHVGLFDDDGDLIWKRACDLRFIYGQAAGDSDRYVRAMSFQRMPGRTAPCLLVLWNVNKCAPSSFVILDGADGSVLLEYDHIGNLVFFKWADIGSKPFILLGGTNNLAAHDGVLSAIDPGRLVSGLAPPYAVEGGPESEIESLEPYLAEYRAGRAPRAGQARYMRFPFSSISKAAGLRWLFVRDADAEGDRFYATIDVDVDCPLYYYLDAAFKPLFVKPGADFARSYETRRRAGHAAGDMTEYLERAVRAVSQWDGETWRIDGGEPASGPGEGGRRP